MEIGPITFLPRHFALQIKSDDLFPFRGRGHSVKRMMFVSFTPIPQRMTRKIVLSALFFVTYSVLFAQTSSELLIGKWKFAGEETFGVVAEPDSLHSNDFVEFRSDGSYDMMKGGTSGTGTYKLNESPKLIFFTPKDGTTLQYFFKKVTPEYLLIEFQTPDLIRTRYRYESVK